MHFRSWSGGRRSNYGWWSTCGRIPYLGLETTSSVCLGLTGTKVLGYCLLGLVWAGAVNLGCCSVGLVLARAVVLGCYSFGLTWVGAIVLDFG